MTGSQCIGPSVLNIEGVDKDIYCSNNTLDFWTRNSMKSLKSKVIWFSMVDQDSWGSEDP